MKKVAPERPGTKDRFEYEVVEVKFEEIGDDVCREFHWSGHLSQVGSGSGRFGVTQAEP